MGVNAMSTSSHGAFGAALPTASAVSVVVCAHTPRRRADIVLALDSLAAQVPAAPGEVLLVIDHCDDLLAWARGRFPGVRVVPNRWPSGLAGARNTGIAEATGEVVAFLDDDARAEADWLARLLAPYRDPTVLGVGGGVVPAWRQGRPRWFPEEFDWVVGCSHSGMPSVAEDVRNFVGANMSYRLEAFERAGGFTVGLGRVGAMPLGCEETEFGIRARRAAPWARFVYEPSARVQHTVGDERGTPSYFARRCFAEGISKAAVSRMAGHQAALASERRYVRSDLPRGLLRDLSGRGASPVSAVAILGGLAATVAGYLRGRAGSIRHIHGAGSVRSVRGCRG